MPYKDPEKYKAYQEIYQKQRNQLPEIKEMNRRRMREKYIPRTPKIKTIDPFKRERFLYTRLKASARRRKLEFTLDLEDIVIPTHCPILGIPLDSRNREYTPSIDRVDNTIGYIKGNINIISCRANRLKSDATIDELKAILNYCNRDHDNISLKNSPSAK